MAINRPKPEERVYHEKAIWRFFVNSCCCWWCNAPRFAQAPASSRNINAPMKNSGRSAAPASSHGTFSNGPTISDMHSTGSSGAGNASRPVRANVRHEDRWFAGRPSRRAKSFTVVPGTSVFATIRVINSSGHFQVPRSQPPTARTYNIVSMAQIELNNQQGPMNP